MCFMLQLHVDVASVITFVLFTLNSTSQNLPMKTIVVNYCHYTGDLNHDLSLYYSPANWVAFSILQILCCKIRQSQSDWIESPCEYPF